MSIYQVLIHPDPRLRLIATDVSSFDPPLKEIVKNMYETMYEYNGVGLAATQVNIQQRIVVMDIPQKIEEATEELENTSIKLTLINPEIIKKSETMYEHEEGCLSIPGQYSNVVRPERIDYRYQDIEGNIHTSSASGLLAVCIQHEIDHLNGELFIDHISRLKKERIEKKLAKQLKANA